MIAPNTSSTSSASTPSRSRSGPRATGSRCGSTYTLDPAQLKTQAASLMAKLKDEGTTSVSRATLVTMAWARRPPPSARYPEWLIGGVGFIDIDLVGQIISRRPRPVGAGLRRQPVDAPALAGTSVAHAAYSGARRRAVDLRRGRLQPAAGPRARHPDGRAEPHARDLRDRAVRLPRRDRAGGHVGLEPRATTHRWSTSARSGGTPAPAPFNGEPGTYVDNGQRYRTATSPRAIRRCSR